MEIEVEIGESGTECGTCRSSFEDISDHSSDGRCGMLDETVNVCHGMG